jgi:hypothetical protein
MSERLDSRAEVLKLARLLDVKPDELSYLSGLPSGELRVLRDRATDRLFTSAPGLARAAAAAKLIPSGLVATISQRAFGPMLCARAAGGADTAKAIEVARRLPATFLADVAVHLDPRRTAEIIAEVPEEVVVPVAEELGRRREHVTMGRFLAFVPDSAVAAAIGALDDETMLRTAFVLEHKDRLDHAIGLLPPERLPGIIDTASRLELWPEALDLLAHVSDERLGPIAGVVAELPPDLVASLVGAVSADGLWESLLPVVRLMADDARVRVAAMPAFHETDVLADILRAATAEDADGLWVELVPLLDALPPEALTRVAGLVTDLDPAALDRLLREAIDAPSTLSTLLELLHRMDADRRQVVITAIDEADRILGETLLTALTDPADIARLVPLVPDDVMAAVRRAAERVGLIAELDAALARAAG